MLMSNETGKRRRRTARRFACAVLAGVMLCAAALAAGCTSGLSIVGAWHNEELAQVIEFNEDGTFVFTTGHETYNGIYVYDDKAKQGTLALMGDNVPFVAEEDELTLGNDEGMRTTFERGDMAIAVITPTPAESQTPEPTPSATPTATPSAMPSATAAATPAASMGLGTMPPMLTLKPQVSLIPGDVIGVLIYGEIAGFWRNTTLGSELKVNMDGTFTYTILTITRPGTFTYDASTNTGEFTQSGYSPTPFTYDEGTDMLTLHAMPDIVFTRM